MADLGPDLLKSGSRPLSGSALCGLHVERAALTVTTNSRRSPPSAIQHLAVVHLRGKIWRSDDGINDVLHFDKLHAIS